MQADKMLAKEKKLWITVVGCKRALDDATTTELCYGRNKLLDYI